MNARSLALVVAVVLSVAACDEIEPPSDAGPPPGEFVNVPWSAVLIRGQPPVAGSEPSITFGAAQVKGSGGCNQFGGDYRYDQRTGAVELVNMAMTAMGCLKPQVNAVETTFAQTLTGVNRLAIDPDGRLHLSGPAGEIVFARAVEGRPAPVPPSLAEFAGSGAVDRPMDAGG